MIRTVSPPRGRNFKENKIKVLKRVVTFNTPKLVTTGLGFSLFPNSGSNTLIFSPFFYWSLACCDPCNFCPLSCKHCSSHGCHIIFKSKMKTLYLFKWAWHPYFRHEKNKVWGCSLISYVETARWWSSCGNQVSDSQSTPHMHLISAMLVSFLDTDFKDNVHLDVLYVTDSLAWCIMYTYNK